MAEIKDIGSDGEEDRLSGDDPYEDQLSSVFAGPLRRDPFGRWPEGTEPIVEVPIETLDANDSPTLLMRTAAIEIASGILPVAEWPTGHESEEEEDRIWRGRLEFQGRWNATWRGRHLSALTLDLFCEQRDDVLRLVFDQDHPVDLMTAYTAAFPGMHGLGIRGVHDPVDQSERKTQHQVTCRDPRLAFRIATAYPGLTPHAPFVESQLYYREDIPTGDDALERLRDLTACREHVVDEPVPGAIEATEPDLLRALVVCCHEEAEPPFIAFPEPVAKALDINSMVGLGGLENLAEADLLRVDPKLAAGLAHGFALADAVAAIRAVDLDRLPVWLDFCDEDAEPAIFGFPGGGEHALYGVLVTREQDPRVGGPFTAIIPVGRTVARGHEAIPACVLAVGSDDSFRWPVGENQFGLIALHSGGPIVHFPISRDFLNLGIKPPILRKEREAHLSAFITATTEPIVCWIGAVLSGLEEQLLLTARASTGEKTYDVIAAAAQPRSVRRALTGLPDAPGLVRRLREFGSLHRVAREEQIPMIDIRASLERAGVDPGHVIRDEVLLRWRATGTVEAILSALHLHRSFVEQILREAGVDFADTPVGHHVTDPDQLAAIAAYRTAGTLEAAGHELGVSGETVRRRIVAADLTVEEIETDGRRRQRLETVEAWERLGRSMAATARHLAIDVRTVRDRLLASHIDPEPRPVAERTAEARELLPLAGTPEAVASLMGVKPATIVRWLRDDPATPKRRGRPPIPDADLDRAISALAEHGSIRAAARALGISPGGMQHRLRLAAARDGPVA